MLILGENGTGKEIFAQAIHNESLRKTSHLLQLIYLLCQIHLLKVNFLAMMKEVLQEQ